MSGPQGADRALRILLAEDNSDIAQLAMGLLRARGHEVSHVDNADEVLPKIVLEAPDLIILDVMMPSEQGLDGFSLCQRIKENPHHRDTPVIIMSAIAQGTGKTEDEMRHRAGADAYIHKPFEAPHFLEVIESLTAK